MINEKMLEMLCLEMILRKRGYSDSVENLYDRFNEIVDEFVEQYELPEIDPNSVKNNDQ